MRSSYFFSVLFLIFVSCSGDKLTTTVELQSDPNAIPTDGSPSVNPGPNSQSIATISVTPSDRGVAPFTVNLQANYGVSGGTYSYRWLSEGQVFSTDATATHTFSTPGTFTIILEVIDGNRTVTASRLIGVQSANAPPAPVEIRGPENITVPQTVTFQYQHNTSAQVYSERWTRRLLPNGAWEYSSFGDFPFTTPGDYEVQVDVITDQGVLSTTFITHAR